MLLTRLFVANVGAEAEAAPKRSAVVATPAADSAPAAATGGGATTPQKATPVFLTPQSIMSFPVASAAVLAVQRLAPGAEWFKLVAALLVGAAVFMVSISDKRARPTDAIGWVSAILIGILNTAILGAAAAGLAGGTASFGL
jgi:hypothetical protein